MSAAYALVLAVMLSSASAESSAKDTTQPRVAAPLAEAIAATPALPPTIDPQIEAWMLDRKIGRPATLHVLYGTLGALQALDVYSTRRAMNAGGTEINPVMKPTAGNQAATIALKAVSTVGSVYFAERAWKKNRKGAVVLMAVVNGVTAAVVARNLRNAR